MAVRNDVTVDWDSSPRVIYVDAPSTEIIIQDLHDTCRFLESQPNAMDNKVLIDTAGKEPLGGGVSVGLTATLKNAQVAFEARVGPEYTQCSVSGGNVVSVDANDSPISPIFPTSFTQVVITASSSATTANQAQLEYSTYNGGVTIDTIIGTAGTKFPIGTPGFPSNNLADTLEIAETRALSDIFVHSSLILNSGDWSAGYKFKAYSPISTLITVVAGANINNCEIWDSTVQGQVDDNNVLRECLILDITSFDGYFDRCGIVGTVSLGGSTQTTMVDCFSNVAGAGVPSINIGSGSALAIRRWSGGLRLTDKTGVEGCSVDLTSGSLTVDPSCVSGSIIVRGTGFTVDNSNGTVVTDHMLHSTQLNELWRLNGLKVGESMTVSDTSRIAGDVDLSIVDNGDGSVTVSRN